MAIIGAILGDIAGSFYEVDRPEDLNWKTCDLFTDKSKFTDDTVMTLAVKFAIKEKISFEDSYRIFGILYPHAGYGRDFQRWMKFEIKEPYNSLGNGAAMKVSYIAEEFHTEDDVINCARKSAECTHNHPEGIKGAIVTAICTYLARNGASKNEIQDYTKRLYPKGEYEFYGDRPIGEYRDIYEWDGRCQNSVPVAIRCFLESDSYEDFLRNVLSLDCDSDTLCAIGGGIAEEFYKGTGFDEDKLLKRYLDERLYKVLRW